MCTCTSIVRAGEVRGCGRNRGRLDPCNEYGQGFAHHAHPSSDSTNLPTYPCMEFWSQTWPSAIGSSTYPELGESVFAFVRGFQRGPATRRVWMYGGSPPSHGGGPGCGRGRCRNSLLLDQTEMESWRAVFVMPLILVAGTTLRLGKPSCRHHLFRTLTVQGFSVFSWLPQPFLWVHSKMYRQLSSKERMSSP